MRCDDVRRIDLGTFVRPSEETGTGQPRVEAVYGYLLRSSAGLLLDTGLGEADFFVRRLLCGPALPRNMAQHYG